MSYVGNTNTTQAFTPAVDYFSGNGSTVAFTLSRPVASTAQVQVVVNNVPQNPTDAFTVLNNTITFTSAPSSGTNNIYVQYTSTINQIIQPSQGTVTTSSLSSSLLVPPAYVSDQTNTSTGYFSIPVGTTAQRPATPTNGSIRQNTTLGYPEWYDATVGSWQSFTSTGGVFSADFIVVAGGGGGGGGYSGDIGGGGGAGGYRELTSQTFTRSTSYTVTVGGGGPGGPNGSTPTAGSNSVFNTTTATGGGYGATNNSYSASNGGNGGSGGGGEGGASGGVGSGGSGNTPSTSPSQGSNGGASAAGGGGGSGAGGGGGAGGVGGNGSGTGGSSVGGAGGVGVASSITGSSVYYAGGGGGGGATSAAGGTGGGGAGGYGGGGPFAGTANTGGGGGGTSGTGANGGSGVVIVKYPDALTITNSGGGLTFSTTSSGGFKVTTFTAGTGNIQFTS